MDVGVDDDRGPAPAKQLGLDQRVLEPQRVRLELRQGRRRGRSRPEKNTASATIRLPLTRLRIARSNADPAHNAAGARSNISRGEVTSRTSAIAAVTRSSASNRASNRWRSRSSAASCSSRSRRRARTRRAARARRDQLPKRPQVRSVATADSSSPSNSRASAVARSSPRDSSRPPAPRTPRTTASRSSNGAPPARAYRATASARLVAPSLRRMFLTWYLIVPSRTTSARATRVGLAARDQAQDLDSRGVSASTSDGSPAAVRRARSPRGVSDGELARRALIHSTAERSSR